LYGILPSVILCWARVRRVRVLSRIQRWKLQALHQAILCILRPTNWPDCLVLLSGWARHCVFVPHSHFGSSFCHHLKKSWCEVGFLQLESKYRNVLPSRGAWLKLGCSRNAHIIHISHAEPGKSWENIGPGQRDARSTRPPCARPF
jgi:hypothetical protein